MSHPPPTPPLKGEEFGVGGRPPFQGGITGGSELHAEIITIGDEILRGEVVNGNAAVIGRALSDIGLPPLWSCTVADDVAKIHNALRTALDRSQVVVLTGGLGPTPDDLTLESLASFFKLEVHEDPALLEHVESFFRARGIKMPDTSRNQARTLSGARQIPNPMGTATGTHIERQDRHVFSLPGVHAEMKRMLAEYVIPCVRDSFPGALCLSKTLRLADSGESQLLARISDMRTVQENVKLAFLPHHGLLDLRLIARSQDPDEAAMQIATAEAILREAAGDHVYTTGYTPLAEVIGNILINRGEKLAASESCTGGLLMNLLTDIPGSSRWFERGFVTYSNESKSEAIGVPSELIDKNGAVSEEVACAMAEGVRSTAHTAWGIGITGIAGPDGGTPEKPVGMVWIAVSSERVTTARLFKLAGERALIRLRAAHGAMYMLWRRLLDS